jgi:hypothetical protein
MFAALRELLVGHLVYARSSVYLSLNGEPHFIREGEMLSSHDALVRRWPEMFTPDAPRTKPVIPMSAR